MSKQPPPAPTASAIGPCPTIIQIVGRPGTGSLPSTFAPPDHPPGLLRNQIWPLLLKIAKPYKSTFPPEPQYIYLTKILYRA